MRRAVAGNSWRHPAPDPGQLSRTTRGPAGTVAAALRAEDGSGLGHGRHLLDPPGGPPSAGTARPAWSLIRERGASDRRGVGSERRPLQEGVFVRRRDTSASWRRGLRAAVFFRACTTPPSSTFKKRPRGCGSPSKAAMGSRASRWRQRPSPNLPSGGSVSPPWLRPRDSSSWAAAATHPQAARGPSTDSSSDPGVERRAVGGQ